MPSESAYDLLSNVDAHAERGNGLFLFLPQLKFVTNDKTLDTLLSHLRARDTGDNVANVNIGSSEGAGIDCLECVHLTCLMCQANTRLVLYQCRYTSARIGSLKASQISWLGTVVLPATSSDSAPSESNYRPLASNSYTSSILSRRPCRSLVVLMGN